MQGLLRGMVVLRLPISGFLLETWNVSSKPLVLRISIAKLAVSSGRTLLLMFVNVTENAVANGKNNRHNTIANTVDLIFPRE